MKEMEYNRKLSDSFAALLEPNGNMRWLFDFVKQSCDLDFLIGKRKNKEWISIYRGLTRIITIIPTSDPRIVLLDADAKYKSIDNTLYGKKSTTFNFQINLENIISLVKENRAFDRYYNNRKEGFYQNELSRKYGINGNENEQFVIIDKEAVIAHADQKTKDLIYGSIRAKYKKLQEEISAIDPKSYGAKLEKKAIGNELDFLALDKEANILLIEYKHGTNTSGVYLSPLQIGLYYDLFTNYPKNDLEDAVLKMLVQKQKIGLINPYWPVPKKINGIIPVLIISEYNKMSCGKKKYDEIMNIVRKKTNNEFLGNIKTYNYTQTKGLQDWDSV
jgi:hypothetical protein